ncbi:hypothetical protein [Anaeromusa acidaminophila]|uniref:hypothetical protein n=1 Tax=Anaeromusa acidaminophila TaxID=81464 RepID=UPI00037187D6|nr:hypothetical protein [Anaeromusa acidaminophila]
MEIENGMEIGAETTGVEVELAEQDNMEVQSVTATDPEEGAEEATQSIPENEDQETNTPEAIPVDQLFKCGSSLKQFLNMQLNALQSIKQLILYDQQYEEKHPGELGELADTTVLEEMISKQEAAFAGITRLLERHQPRMDVLEAEAKASRQKAAALKTKRTPAGTKAATSKPAPTPKPEKPKKATAPAIDDQAWGTLF